jgi:septal ring factor EnvC (AmiA/AmiB activator)
MEIYYGRIQSNYDEAKKELAEKEAELKKVQTENSELKKQLAELKAKLPKSE